MAEIVHDLTSGPAIADGDDRLHRRAQIASLQGLMEGMAEADKLDISAMTFHHFASGVYAREARLPAGTLAVGKIHRTSHLAILLQGRVTITSELGSETFDAPKLMISPPGTKRVAFAHTDAVWVTFHAAGEDTDPEAIEARLIAPNFDELALEAAAQQLAEQR